MAEGLQVGRGVGRHEFAHHLGRLDAFPGEDAHVASGVVAMQERPQLFVDELPQRRFARQIRERGSVRSLSSESVQGRLKHLGLKPLLAFEMVVDRRLVDLRPADDVAHARAVEPLFGE